MSLIESGLHISAHEAARINIQTVNSCRHGTSNFITPLAKTHFEEIESHRLGITHQLAKLTLTGVRWLTPPAGLAFAGKMLADHLVAIGNEQRFYEAVGMMFTQLIALGIGLYALKSSGLLEATLEKIVACVEEVLNIKEREKEFEHALNLHKPLIQESLKKVYDEMAEDLAQKQLSEELLEQINQFKSKLLPIRRSLRQMGVESPAVLSQIESVIHRILHTRVQHGDQAKEHNAQLLRHLSAKNFQARMYSYKTLAHLVESKQWKIPRSIAGVLLPLLAQTDLLKMEPVHLKIGLYSLAALFFLLALYELRQHSHHAALEQSQAKEHVHQVLRDLTAYFDENQANVDPLREKVAEIKKRLLKDGFDADLLTLPAT